MNYSQDLMLMYLMEYHPEATPCNGHKSFKTCFVKLKELNQWILFYDTPDDKGQPLFEYTVLEQYSPQEACK